MELKQRKFINNIPQFDVGKNGQSSFEPISEAPIWVDKNNQGGTNSQNSAKSRWGLYDGYGTAYSSQTDVLSATTRSINNPNAGYNYTNNIGYDLGEFEYVGYDKTSKQESPSVPAIITGSSGGSQNSNSGLQTDSGGNAAGFGGQAGMIGNIAQMGNQDIVAWYNHVFHQPKAGQILSEAGTTNANVMGYGYRRINDIDEASYKRREKEQAVGGTLNAMAHGVSTGMQTGGPVGAIVGGIAGLAGGVSAHILGSKNLKEELTYANNLKNRLNIFNRSGAMTQAKQDYYYTNKGYTLDDVLYANRGKDLKRPIL